MSNLPASITSLSKQLVRIWHVETLDTVAAHSNAVRFLRTSYCVVPFAWKKLDALAVRDRVLYALQLSYRFRNHQSAKSGDEAEMLWVAVAFEFVDKLEMAPTIDGDEDEDHERVTVRTDLDIHPDVIDAAVSQVIATWYAARPGLDAKPWTDAFSTFRYDDDDTCHLVKFRERAALFDASFGANAVL
jgi:hypothetical protein